MYKWNNDIKSETYSDIKFLFERNEAQINAG